MKTERSILTTTELAAFMACVATRQHKWRARNLAAFALMSYAGLAPCEVLEVQKRDLHLGAERPWIVVHGEKRNRNLVIPWELAKALADRRNELKVGKARLFPMSVRTLRWQFDQYAKRCGITGRKLYSLRHSAGFRIYKAAGGRRESRKQAIVRRVLGMAHGRIVYTDIERANALLETSGLPL